MFKKITMNKQVSGNKFQVRRSREQVSINKYQYLIVTIRMQVESRGNMFLDIWNFLVTDIILIVIFDSSET